MPVALFVPVVLGVLSVLQATLNRQLAKTWGLAPTAVLNMSIALIIALAAFVLCVTRGADPSMYRAGFDGSVVRWWWVLPGVFGFAIVFGLPWAVGKLGALPVFVALVGSQMCASALWDRLVEGVPLSVPRVIGALFALLSVLLVNWK